MKVVPRASRSGIAGSVGDRLKVRVAAPPEKGRANDEVVDVVAKALGVPRRSVRIVAGAGSPLKDVEVDGISTEDAQARIE